MSNPKFPNDIPAEYLSPVRDESSEPIFDTDEFQRAANAVSATESGLQMSKQLWVRIGAKGREATDAEVLEAARQLDGATPIKWCPIHKNFVANGWNVCLPRMWTGEEANCQVGDALVVGPIGDTETELGIDDA